MSATAYPNYLSTMPRLPKGFDVFGPGFDPTCSVNPWANRVDAHLARTTAERNALENAVVRDN